MINIKTITSYNKAIINLNKAIANEIDYFIIDNETLLVQKHYMIINNLHYVAVIQKFKSEYKYNIRLSYNDELKYEAIFEFDIYTGLAKIIETICVKF